MNDLISRQAAIDAVNEHVYKNRHLNDYEQGWNDACDYCADEWLEDLPSAQSANISKTEDLIIRGDAINAVFERIKQIGFEDNVDVLSIRQAVREVPSAQPEQKKGKWLRYGEDRYLNSVDTVYWQCDQCLESYFGRAKRIPNYCPNCGAYMRKEEMSK